MDSLGGCPRRCSCGGNDGEDAELAKEVDELFRGADKIASRDLFVCEHVGEVTPLPSSRGLWP